MPFFLARVQIPGTDVVVDPCGAILVLIVTGLLCVGIKEVMVLLLVVWFSFIPMIICLRQVFVQSSFVQSITTTANVCVMIFVIIAGGYLGFQTGWVGYSFSSG